MNKFLPLYLSLALLLLSASAADTENAETTVVTESTETVTMESTETAPVESGEAMPMENAETMAMESGEAAVSPPQTSTPTSIFPTSLLTTFAVDIHYLSGQGLNTSQVSYHFCSSLSPDFLQCDLYNGTANNSRLLGVELITTGDNVMTFDEEERKLWYPHAYEVLNGFLFLPEASPADDLATMQVLINTYAKTTYFYYSDPNFPLGPPQAAFGWVADAQVNNTLAAEADQALNMTTTFEQRKQARQGLVAPAPIAGVSSWQQDGQSPQYEVFTISVDQSTNNPQ